MGKKPQTEHAGMKQNVNNAPIALFLSEENVFVVVIVFVVFIFCSFSFISESIDI